MPTSRKDYWLSWAYYYRAMGFNVTCILPYKNDWNYYNENPFKAPGHAWAHLEYEEQTIWELESYNWDDAVGIGVVLGYKDLRCIDVDGIVDKNYSSLDEFCLDNDLSLDNDDDDLYPDEQNKFKKFFVTKTPNGRHFYFRAEMHDFELNYGETKVFYPKKSNHYNKFTQLELRYRFHCVLPPSMNNNFQFYKPVRLLSFRLYNNFAYTNNQAIADLIYQECEIGNDLEIKKENLGSWGINTSVRFKKNSNGKLLMEKKETILIIDTESNGLPEKNKKVSETFHNWPELLQFGYQEFSIDRILVDIGNEYIDVPENFKFDEEASRIHGINREFLESNRCLYTNKFESRKSKSTIEVFINNSVPKFIRRAFILVGHNIKFDLNVIEAEYLKLGKQSPFKKLIIIDTMLESINFCNLPNLKYPKLNELYAKLFEKEMELKHDAFYDSQMTALCFWELVKLKVIDLSKYFTILDEKSTIDDKPF